MVSRPAAAVTGMRENNFPLSTFYVLSIELHALRHDLNLDTSDKNRYPHFKGQKTEADQLLTQACLIRQSAVLPEHHAPVVVCCY